MPKVKCVVKENPVTGEIIEIPVTEEVVSKLWDICEAYRTSLGSFEKMVGDVKKALDQKEKARK